MNINNLFKFIANTNDESLIEIIQWRGICFIKIAKPQSHTGVDDPASKCFDLLQTPLISEISL